MCCSLYVLVILHSGQTGVERGAHFGSVASGTICAGFMPLDRRDEFGPIPQDVAEALTPCLDRGPRPAVRANVALASGVLLVVPDAKTPHKFTAMDVVLQLVRSVGVPSLVADARTNTDDAAAWAHSLPQSSGSVRILVTGPRGTRWAQGQSVARRLVGAVGLR